MMWRAAAPGVSPGGGCGATGSRCDARVFVLIVLASFAAPLYANDIAHTDPFQSNVDGTHVVNGKKVPVLQPSTRLGLGVTPIGPTWDSAPISSAPTPGPRRRGAPALRRPDLTPDRHRVGASSPASSPRSSALVAGFFGGVWTVSFAAPRRRLGVPRLPARDLPLDGAADAAASQIGPISCIG